MLNICPIPPDLFKMYHKLEEFFAQQFKSSRLVLFSLEPAKAKQSIRVKAAPKKPPEGDWGL